MKTSVSVLGLLSLALLTACGGGSAPSGTITPPPTPASSLSYQDPTAAGFRLVKNTTTSTSTRLVLDLIGPSSTTTAKGVAFFLTTDTSKVTWVHPSGSSGSCIAVGTVFPLGSAPKLLADKVNGNQLQVGIFQKGTTATTLGNAPILSLALDLKGAAVPKGTVSLSPASANPAKVLNADGTLSDITINVGTLSAQ